MREFVGGSGGPSPKNVLNFESPWLDFLHFGGYLLTNPSQQREVCWEKIIISLWTWLFNLLIFTLKRDLHWGGQKAVTGGKQKEGLGGFLPPSHIVKKGSSPLSEFSQKVMYVPVRTWSVIVVYIQRVLYHAAIIEAFFSKFFSISSFSFQQEADITSFLHAAVKIFTIATKI